jgi:hypothetical protein
MKDRQSARSRGAAFPPIRLRHATLTHPEWLGLLLDQEVSYRRDRRLLARLRYATILDRIVHNAQRINLTGHSLRRARVYKTSKEGVPT